MGIWRARVPKRNNIFPKGGWKLVVHIAIVAIKKYKFFTRKTDFIGFIIKLGKISIDLKKVKAIVN